MVKCHCEKSAFCLTLAFTSAEYLTIVVFKCSPLIDWIEWQGSVIVSKFDFFVIILYDKIMLSITRKISAYLGQFHVAR